MNDALFVEVGESSEGLAHDDRNEAFFKGAALHLNIEVRNSVSSVRENTGTRRAIVLMDPPAA